MVNPLDEAVEDSGMIQVTIDNTPQDAILQHGCICTRMDTTCVYTHGSGMNGHIGPVAVTLPTPDSTNSSPLHKRTYYLGRDNESTVYAAELKGILLALQILKTDPDLNGKWATIFTDNQSALRTVRKPGNTSVQYSCSRNRPPPCGHIAPFSHGKLKFK